MWTLNIISVVIFPHTQQSSTYTYVVYVGNIESTALFWYHTGGGGDATDDDGSSSSGGCIGKLNGCFNRLYRFDSSWWFVLQLKRKQNHMLEIIINFILYFINGSGITHKKQYTNLTHTFIHTQYTTYIHTSKRIKLNFQNKLYPCHYLYELNLKVLFILKFATIEV